MTHCLAQALTENLGKPFIIENRGGANGNIGTELAAKSPNDGTTLLFTGAGLVTNPSLYKKAPYDPIKDFEPVGLMALGPNVLVVHPSLPVHSVQELIALAKAHPGQRWTNHPFASPHGCRSHPPIFSIWRFPPG